MTRQPRFPLSLSFFVVLVLIFGTRALAQRLANPCDGIRADFKARIAALKAQQKLVLENCRATSSNSSPTCGILKSQQKAALRELERQRDLQVRECIGFPRTQGISSSNTADCYNARQYYVDHYYHRNPGDDDHYPSPSKSGPGKNGTGNVNAGNGEGNRPGSRLPRDDKGRDGNSGPYPRRDGSSSSTTSSHGSGGSSNAAGSGPSYSGGGHSSGSYSGGGNSAGSSSGSSHSSGSTYSGGGTSGGSSSASSSSSSSSSSSHDSGAARPK